MLQLVRNWERRSSLSQGDQALASIRILEPQAEFDPPSLFGVGMITKEEDFKKIYNHIDAPFCIGRKWSH